MLARLRYKLNNIRKQIIDAGADNENYTVVNEGVQEGEELLLTAPDKADEYTFTGTEIYDKILKRKEDELEKLKQSVTEKEVAEPQASSGIELNTKGKGTT